MADCRFILDNISDYYAEQGKLIVGSEVVDISAAEMRAGDSSWTIKISTVNPALQHPAVQTKVALYLDTDGRFENNGVSGALMGADQVYGFVSQPDGSWKAGREAFDFNRNEFADYKTNAKLSFESNAYVIEIPFGELPKDSKAYWRVMASERDGANMTADYAPDSGFSCAPSLAAQPNPFLSQAKDWVFGWPGRIALWVVVILALAVIFWKRKKKI